MLPYLGLRGRVTTIVLAAAATVGALLAAVDHDWRALITLALLAYVTVLAGVTWGAAQTSVRTVEHLAQRQQKVHRQGSTQMGLLQTKLDRTHAQVSRLSAAPKASPTPVPTQTSALGPVERRYAGLLDEPMSAPNSRLLSLLEILAKDATTRRADDAVLRSAIHDLREMVEMQQTEISTLSQLVHQRDAFSQVHSAR
jgi:hypothetical protein